MTPDPDVEIRIRTAIGRLLTEPVPDGLKCDVRSLCVLAGVPRATLYRTYPHLKIEFDQKRATAHESGQQPDPRAGQIERLKTEAAKLHAQLHSKDTELKALKSFRAEALSRLAAQHDEITSLRERMRPTRSDHPPAVPLHRT